MGKKSRKRGAEAEFHWGWDWQSFGRLIGIAAVIAAVLLSIAAMLSGNALEERRQLMGLTELDVVKKWGQPISVNIDGQGRRCLIYQHYVQSRYRRNTRTTIVRIGAEGRVDSVW